MSERIGVELLSPAGEPLRVEWDEAALSGLSASAEQKGPTWRLSGDLDWDAVDVLRVLSGRFEDGHTLVVAGLRPAEAEGHGDELLAGVLDGSEAVESGDVLLSTEYGADELPRRIGLEIRPGEEGIPLRIAGDVEHAEGDVEGSVRRVRASVRLKLNGTAGTGVYEILTAA